ncbi:Hypothetical predicted protein [Mytilus galloprovincialis]|uniref:Uncharacterized protein n=1 Tax=Mytilus galloprovincialis TaxID=29158 RepID=A0A8B6D790_MYTGA|nr:Hypothetical predicted protein [Mytilus galloprovincialis]
MDTLCLSILFLEHLVLSAVDLGCADFEDQLHYIWSSFSALALDPGSPRKHSIALVGTPRWVDGKNGESFSFHMAQQNKPSKSALIHKKRKCDDSEPCREDDSWPRFIVIKGTEEKPISKISPFVIHKQIQSVAGTVKKVSKMRSGNLLVECSNKSQSTNLLTMSTISNFPVSASPHNSLNSCKGIIRDRSQYLGDLTVEEIGEELSSQGVTNVIRFQIKKNGNIIKLNTYLLTFRTPTPPPSITLGCFGIRVDMFIPKPNSMLYLSKVWSWKQTMSCTKSTRAPSPLRSPEKKDVQKKPVNTSSQKSSDSRSRGRGRGGVKPAACRSWRSTTLLAQQIFNTYRSKLKWKSKVFRHPKDHESQGERNKNAGKLDSIRPSFIK